MKHIIPLIWKEMWEEDVKQDGWPWASVKHKIWYNYVVVVVVIVRKITI